MIDLAPGVHAIVGAPSLSEWADRARAGGRKRVAHVPIEPALPDALRVEESLHLATLLRGDAPHDAALRLEELGVQALARRPVRSLSREEARAVALTEALTSPAVTVLFVDEPLGVMDARALPRLRRALHEKAKSGACVVLGTASPRDAADLADHVFYMQAGKAVRIASPLVFPGPVELSLIAEEAQGLAAELSAHEAVRELVVRGRSIVVRGDDAAALATAVSRAVLRTGADVTAMTLSNAAVRP